VVVVVNPPPSVLLQYSQLQPLRWHHQSRSATLTAN
jgi:hypothetical protein